MWPEIPRVDSTTFALYFAFPNPSPDGRPQQAEPTGRPRFLVFSLPVPWMTQAVEKPGNPLPAYPSEARSRSLQAKVLMQFVVDTSGRADRLTIKHAPSQRAQVARMSADHQRVYRAFIQAAAQNIPRMRFDPATIGGCKIRTLVQLPFEFSIGR